MKYTYEQIEALLEQKSFEELSVEERAGVQLSATEYAQQQQVLEASKQVLLQRPIPPANALPQLSAQFKQKHQRPAFWKRPIPAYQVAFLLLLITGLFLSWPPKEVTPTIKEKLVYVTQLDTIVQERIQIEEKVVYQEKKIVVIQRDTLYLLPPTTEEERKQFYQGEGAPKEKQQETIFAKQPKSKSMKEMNGLMDFVVEVE